MKTHIQYMAYLALLLLCGLKTSYGQVQSALCPENCINRTCDDPPFALSCSFGCSNESFYGDRCLSRCPSTCTTCYRYFNQINKCYGCVGPYYNSDTVKDCSLKCPAGCSSCNSDKYCTACARGFYMNEANLCSHCPSNCIACTSDTECTECIDRFAGNNCQNCVDGFYGKECVYPCPFRCQRCTSYLKCQLCKPGFYNNEPSVTDCTFIRPQCPSNCIDCTSISECTSCKNGFYLTDTEKTCTSKCPTRCRLCVSDLACTVCSENFTGEDCRNCTEGKYGSACDEDCPDYCLTCTSSSECQSCKDGHFIGSATMSDVQSNDCSLKCPDNCISCFNDSYCYSCSDNFTGSICTHCMDGYFGDNCSAMCSVRCLESLCERFTGRCLSCPSRFNGRLCEECSPGFHGNNCDENCSVNCLNSVCNRQDGQCKEGCVNKNFLDMTCSGCVDGFYGNDCSLHCPTGCQQGCDKLNGTCSQCSADFSEDRDIAGAVVGYLMGIVIIVLLLLNLLRYKRGCGRIWQRMRNFVLASCEKQSEISNTYDMASSTTVLEYEVHEQSRSVDGCNGESADGQQDRREIMSGVYENLKV